MSRATMTFRRLLLVMLVMLPLLAMIMLSPWLESSAPAAAERFRVFPGIGIGPIEVGDTRSGLESFLEQPDPEGGIWAYTIRATGRTGVVMVSFNGQHAKTIFTFDRAFEYEGVNVGDDSDEALSALRRDGFHLGRCARMRALFTADRLTVFRLHRGEVESIYVLSDAAPCKVRRHKTG